jgi:hypothetical protein
MFLPYETTVNLWFNASPIYRWEPLPPVVEAGNEANAAALANPDAPDGETPASCVPRGLPAMRLVFKGLRWTAYPVYGIRENLAWNEASATLRQSDEQHRDDALREARKLPTKPPAPKSDW